METTWCHCFQWLIRVMQYTVALFAGVFIYKFRISTCLVKLSFFSWHLLYMPWLKNCAYFFISSVCSLMATPLSNMYLIQWMLMQAYFCHPIIPRFIASEQHDSFPRNFPLLVYLLTISEDELTAVFTVAAFQCLKRCSQLPTVPPPWSYFPSFCCCALLFCWPFELCLLSVNAACYGLLESIGF